MDSGNPTNLTSPERSQLQDKEIARNHENKDKINTKSSISFEPDLQNSNIDYRLLSPNRDISVEREKIEQLKEPSIGSPIPTWVQIDQDNQINQDSQENQDYQENSLIDQFISHSKLEVFENSTLESPSPWWTLSIPSKIKRKNSLIENGIQIPNGPFTINNPDSLGLSSPWRNGNLPSLNGQQSEIKSPKSFSDKIHWFMLNNPYFPIFLRLINIIWAIIGVGVAARMYSLAHSNDLPINPSTIMALIIHPIALVYLLFTLIDEYTRPPIGLRSLLAKFRLITLDVLFIILWSAELALAFDMLHDPIRGCYNISNESNENSITREDFCDLQTTLIVFVFTGLIAWLMNFLSALQRILERLSATSERRKRSSMDDYFGV